MKKLVLLAVLAASPATAQTDTDTTPPVIPSNPMAYYIVVIHQEVIDDRMPGLVPIRGVHYYSQADCYSQGASLVQDYLDDEVLLNPNKYGVLAAVALCELVDN